MEYFLRSRTRGGIVIPINANILKLASTVDYATDNGEDFLKTLLSKAAEKSDKIPVTILLLRKQIPEIDKAWLSAYRKASAYVDGIFGELKGSDVPHVRKALIDRRYKILGDNIVID